MARILIVDDDRAILEFAARALAGGGHDVVRADTAFVALDHLSTRSFDLLLTDIAMPEMDGIALALKASKDFPALRILLMSGYAEERERAHNLDALIHGVLAKPFALDLLLTEVVRALGGPDGPSHGGLGRTAG